MVCRVLNVSRSGFYSYSESVESEEIRAEEAVIHCFTRHNGNYGRIRIRKALLKEGIDISEYRIAGILRKNGMKAKSGRSKIRRAPKPTEQQYVEENLVPDKFSVKVPNQLWCSDITVLSCKAAKLYLCGVIDVATRRIVGWSIAKNQTQVLVQDAFNMAVGRNPNRPVDAIYHSDRGCQYTAKKTKDLIESFGFRKSMSRPGTPSDNQPIESFWRTLECEMPEISGMGFQDAATAVVNYIELYYNTDRIHSGIDYHTPNEFFTLLSVHES